MTIGRTDRFAHHYRGRHAPEDARWWVDHPDAPGPSSAAPPAQELADTVDGLRAAGRSDLADLLSGLVEEVLREDQRLAAHAIARIEQD